MGRGGGGRRGEQGGGEGKERGQEEAEGEQYAARHSAVRRLGSARQRRR